MDSDFPWEDDPQVEYAPQADWEKITREFTNSGYREGILAGKEASLQEGFDAGFADVGVPVGRELGNLRGAVSAIGSLLSSQSPASGDLEELRTISSALSAIQFSDIAPRDLEAEQHAREHLASDDREIAEGAELDAVTDTQPAMKDLAELKERLVSLGARLGLALSFPSVLR